MRCKLIHWWIKNKQNCKVQLCTGILNWFQIRSELQALYREEIRQVTKTNSNHFFLLFLFLFWGVDFVIFDLFSSLGHSYFLMILRIQHISLCFQFFFSGKYPRFWKQIAERNHFLRKFCVRSSAILRGILELSTLPVA